MRNKTDFNFGKATTMVFDDMLNRSVPYYSDIQRMMAEIARAFAQSGTCIYDLGCSTGTTLLNISRNISDPKITIVGVDSSESMLKEAKAKLRKSKVPNDIRLKKLDLNDNIKFRNASVVIMNLTLQFVRPLYRDRLIKNIHDSLRPNGVLILVEKVLGENSLFNRTFIDLYYDFKERQGYSKLEIAQKREALENVLIPYRLNENIVMLKRNGFAKTDIFFKWYNFCGIVALK